MLPRWLHSSTGDTAHKKTPPPYPPPCPAGIKFSDPALDGGAAIRSAVYTWSVRLQGAAAGPLHNCWLTDGVVPVSKNLYSL